MWHDVTWCTVTAKALHVGIVEERAETPIDHLHFWWFLELVVIPGAFVVVSLMYIDSCSHSQGTNVEQGMNKVSRATMIKGIYLPNLGWSSVEMAKHAHSKGHRSKGTSPTTHLKPNQTKWIRSSKITNWWQTLVACIITSQKYEQMRLILLYRWAGTETCTPETPIWTPENHMFTEFPCCK